MLGAPWLFAGRVKLSSDSVDSKLRCERQGGPNDQVPVNFRCLWHATTSFAPFRVPGVFYGSERGVGTAGTRAHRYAVYLPRREVVSRIRDFGVK